MAESRGNARGETDRWGRRDGGRGRGGTAASGTFALLGKDSGDCVVIVDVLEGVERGRGRLVDRSAIDNDAA